jgi:hypothetical protein
VAITGVPVTNSSTMSSHGVGVADVSEMVDAFDLREPSVRIAAATAAADGNDQVAGAVMTNVGTVDAEATQ